MSISVPNLIGMKEIIDGSKDTTSKQEAQTT
jgi:hypothetical protein